MYKLEKIGPSTYLMPREGGMKVPGLIVASEQLLPAIMNDRSLEQVSNVAHLQGIVGHSIAMPDIHWGYGFPIGGVAAMDAETGVISPGGVGYDINCGVRLAVAPLKYRDFPDKKKRKLLNSLYKNIPSGIGKGHKTGFLSNEDFRHLINKGSSWSVEQGYGFTQDIEHTESHGFISGGDLNAVSAKARERGQGQLGSIGSGNHFVEVGEVQKLVLPDVAAAWGVEEGQVYILIHSGSRGFGHQVCQDTLDHFIARGFAKGLPDKQLVAAPLHGPEGKQYFSAMAAAANFAFNNRQQILHYVRQSFKEILGIEPEQIRLIYDVCHNIAKFEEYNVDGNMKKLCVHRKGATRAFGPGSKELAPMYQVTGQPVLVPGDMGRASYLMVGQGNPMTWCSACHGAGRARSRVQSLKHWSGRSPIKYMEEQGVLLMAESNRTIAEEMPDAYKDVDLVTQACQEAGLANIVARLKPQLVIKG